MPLVGILLGIVFVTPLVVFYLLFVRWCDRFEPEPWWLVLLAFAWGAIFATVGGGFTSSLVQAIVAKLVGATSGGAGMEAFGATVLAPVFEEGFKGLGVALIALASALGLRELDGALDGAIYGGVIGLGFTLTEDILYVSHQFEREGFGGFVVLFFLRTILLGLSHCTFTAMTGLGFGIASEARTLGVKIAAPLVGYAGAMALHAVHNALPTFFGEGGLVAMLIISWAVDVVFFLVLWVLVMRDRATVIRELSTELGRLLHPNELKLVASYIALSLHNLKVLSSSGWAAFRVRRHKQLALVKLAFLKARRRRGEQAADLDTKEASLRQEIDLLTRQGIRVGG